MVVQETTTQHTNTQHTTAQQTTPGSTMPGSIAAQHTMPQHTTTGSTTAQGTTTHAQTRNPVVLLSQHTAVSIHTTSVWYYLLFAQVPIPLPGVQCMLMTVRSEIPKPFLSIDRTYLVSLLGIDEDSQLSPPAFGCTQTPAANIVTPPLSKVAP